MTDTSLVPQNGTTTTEIVSQFGTTSGFELLQRQAQMLANSSMVPEQFSIFGKDGKIKPVDAQKYAVANSIIALEISHRIGASPLMVAQNLVVIYGRPTWSSQFVIAAVNASGKFSPLRFEITGEKDARTCIAWALDRKTGDRLEGPPVSIEMAKKEGWYGKNGSKWQSMPELMLRYRAAAFFGRLYAPDLLMGMRSVDEAYDIGDDVIDVEPEPSKVADINAEIKAAKKANQKNAEPEKPTDTPPPPEQKQPGPLPESKPEPKPEQTGAIPPQILKEMAEIDSKTSIDMVDVWCHKHIARLTKLHGDTWATFLMDHAEKRRCFLRGDVAPGEVIPGIIVNPTNPEPEIEMIICPENGRPVARTDCELSECRNMCPAFNGQGGSKLSMDV